jgi:hypothetical protein
MNSLLVKGMSLMDDCTCKDKTDRRTLIDNNVSICFFTILAPGNTFDPTRQGRVLVNGQDLKLSSIQTKCKVCDQCECECECEVIECAILTGCLFWTVSIPIFSSCAPSGSNFGFQSVSGSQIINQEVCGDLSNFNPCNVSAKLEKITPKDPCEPDFQSDEQPLVGTFIFQPNVPQT